MEFVGDTDVLLRIDSREFDAPKAIDRFVQETLSEEGKMLLEAQDVAIRGAYKARSGRLLSGRSVRTSSSQLVLQHPIYERFLDISHRRKKSKRIHNRFVFAAYSAIVGKLAAGIREEAKDEIEKSI